MQSALSAILLVSIVIVIAHHQFDAFYVLKNFPNSIYNNANVQILATFAVITYLLRIAAQNMKPHIEQLKKKLKYYTYQIRPEDYESYTQKHTEQALKELKQNPKFIEMQQKKGFNPAN